MLRLIRAHGKKTLPHMMKDLVWKSHLVSLLLEAKQKWFFSVFEN